MSCDMAQGEGLEAITGLYGEAEGESRLSSLSAPSEPFIQLAAPPLSPSSCGLIA